MTLKKISKFKQNLIRIAAACVVNLFFFLTNPAQEIEVKIKITSLAPSQSRVRVEGKFLNSKSVLRGRDWSFLQNYADVSELGERIENLNLSGEKGEKLEVKKLIAGEYLADKPALFFEYDVKTDVPSRQTSAAHASWLAPDHGLLMLNDLLPQWNGNQSPISATVVLTVPFDWKISSAEAASGENTFEVKDIEKAIFLVGKNWREKTLRVDKTDLSLAMAGDWQFSDDEAAQMAASILGEHRRTFGGIPVPKAQVFLLPFPQTSNQTDRWRAETRGATVTVLSGALPFKSQALQRLHEQLRHEILHLWAPNSLALSGNYDWFYEGFTIYQALRTGVRMNQIRFEDFLNTLARAYDLSQNQSGSLIEISNRRWTAGGNNSVYARGMVAAFLCDAALLRESRGKRSLSDIFRGLYQSHRVPHTVQDGNTAVLGVLKSRPELLPIVQNYIEGSAKIQWRDELNKFGIEAVDNNSSTELKVLAKLTREQKDLLDKLGYNQWRKLLQKTK